jgi:hypothetical protein
MRTVTDAGCARLPRLARFAGGSGRTRRTGRTRCSVGAIRARRTGRANRAGGPDRTRRACYDLGGLLGDLFKATLQLGDLARQPIHLRAKRVRTLRVHTAAKQCRGHLSF